MLVRDADPSDAAGMYAVCLGTADSGHDGTDLFSDPDLVGHNYVGPYLACPSARCWVLVDGDTIVGYSIGARDTVAFEEFFNDVWAPSLQDRYPLTALDDPTLTDDDRWMIRRLNRTMATDEALVRNYPGHGHIDILPVGQGHGHGRVLMERAMDWLRDEGVRGIHLDVSPRNARARAFYAHLGFEQGPEIDDLSFLVRSL